MIKRVTHPDRPAFQLRKGEEGLSVFVREAVDPPLADEEILAAFRADNIVVSRLESMVEEQGLQLVPSSGSEKLPERLRDSHYEIRAGMNQDRATFKKALTSLEVNYGN